MLLEASVGFLGYAAAESDSWGRMIGDGRRYLPQAWWLVLAPGVLLLVVSWAAGRVDSRPR
jgi:peptide/nickel transport system permease protein